MIYRNPDQKPAPIGHMQGFYQDKLEFPTAVMDRINADTMLAKTPFQERVVVQFIVCEDGGICNLQIVACNPRYPELGVEALRVMRLSPTWKPAVDHSVPVKSYCAQSFTFSMQ